MAIMAFGKRMSGELLFDAVDEQKFAHTLAAALERSAPSLQALADTTTKGVTFRAEIGRRVKDAGDPLQAGWTFLVAKNDPHITDRWHARIQPFLHAVNQFLGVQPSGLAMEDMNKKYSVCNVMLNNVYDRLKRGTFKWTPETERHFVDTWIIRSDAQNYMIFGDPAASLRIPE